MVYYEPYTWYIMNPIHGILHTIHGILYTTTWHILSIIFKSNVFATFQKKTVLKKSNVIFST
jgi:hypothetical protein